MRTTESLLTVCRTQSARSQNRDVIFPLHEATHLRNVTPGEKLLLKAQSYIGENVSENFQLSQVADHCCVSDSHLSRIFRDVGGTTFMDYVLHTRIRRAIELLEDVSVAVTQICYDVGFRDASYFARVFRRHVGMSPSQYRQKVLRGEARRRPT